MRALLLVPLALLFVQPAIAQSTLPDGVEPLLTCGNVYSLKSDDAKEQGDEDTATEFFYRGDALIWQARSMLEAAGYDANRVENVVMTSVLTTSFRYGAGEGEAMLADCLAAEDSP